jgi:hypothetical protein
MSPTIHLKARKQKQPWEFAVRFAFGGTVTVATQLIARSFGPGVAGLFLAFPAILPATLTLIRSHDGPREASRDALGAVPGSAGLTLFAAYVWKGFGADYSPLVVLPTAVVLWLASGVVLWWSFILATPPGLRHPRSL